MSAPRWLRKMAQDQGVRLAMRQSAVKLLEYRARGGKRVEISASFARWIAAELRQNGTR